jgi:hypothetical protein
LKRRGIAAEVRNKGMRAFVTSGGEKENDVPDESEGEKFRSNHGDRLTVP